MLLPGDSANGHPAAAPFLLRGGPEQQRAEYTHNQLQKRSVTLLLMGALCGFLGFFFAGVLGMEKIYWEGEDLYNFRGERFRSGAPYHPQTVSEMVYNPRSPEGKSFSAFCLIGAICILTSWYPWHLRNVYIGDDAMVCGSCGPAWLNMREFLPPIGMLLVTCIPTTPPVNRTFGDKVTGALHTLGAVLMIGGYAICEIHALCCTKSEDKSGVHFKPGEKVVRLVLIACSLLCGIVFQACGAMAPVPADSPLTTTCADVWVVPTGDDLTYVMQGGNVTASGGTMKLGLAMQISTAIRQNQRLLENTASGGCQLVKSMEFWFEVLAGLFMIASHLAIWYFCPERHLDLPENLPDLSKQELEAQGYDSEYVNFGYGELSEDASEQD